MIDKKLLEELDKVDKVISCLNDIIQILYNKAQDKKLDSDTIAFLIYQAESIQKVQLDLKDKNIEFIKEFIPYTSERSRLLCETIAERSHMEQNYNYMQKNAIKYFEESQSEIEQDSCVRK